MKFFKLVLAVLFISAMAVLGMVAKSGLLSTIGHR